MMDTIRPATAPSVRTDGSKQTARQLPGPGASTVAPAPARTDASAAPAPPAQPESVATQVAREELQALLDQVGSRIQPESRALSFRVSEEIDGVVVSVIDNATDELIRQIPSETMVRLAEKLKQLDAEPGGPGLLFSDQA